jgi:hypothetical protein
VDRRRGNWPAKQATLPVEGVIPDDLAGAEEECVVRPGGVAVQYDAVVDR